MTIAEAIKLIRPELDIYSLSDREVEKAAGSTEAACFRRIFYQVEEPLELHLSILDGIADRYSTPYFDNLQAYAQDRLERFMRSRLREASRSSNPTGYGIWASSMG